MSNETTEPQEAPKKEETGQIPADQIDLGKFLRLASGADDDGAPRSSVSVALLSLTEDGRQLKSSQQTDFRNATSYFAVYGGAMVVESVFPAQARTELTRASRIIRSYLPHFDNLEYRSRNGFTLIVTPLPLYGKIMLAARELMYSTLYKNEKDKLWHLIMVFSVSEEDGSIEYFENEDADLSNLKQEVERELERQIREVSDEYNDVVAEIDQLEEKQSDVEEFTSELKNIDLGKEEHDDSDFETDDFSDDRLPHTSGLESEWMRTSGGGSIWDSVKDDADSPWMRFSSRDENDSDEE